MGKADCQRGWFKDYDQVFSKLGTTNGEKNIHKLVQTRDMKPRDLKFFQCFEVWKCLGKLGVGCLSTFSIRSLASIKCLVSGVRGPQTPYYICTYNTNLICHKQTSLMQIVYNQDFPQSQSTKRMQLWVAPSTSNAFPQKRHVTTRNQGTAEKKGVPLKYTKVIKDMYIKVVNSVRTSFGITSEFSVTIGLHQGLALSIYLFAQVINELTRPVQDEVPSCMFF